MRKAILALVVLAGATALAIDDPSPVVGGDPPGERPAPCATSNERQGGETISEATGIWSLPFSGSGTTNGYADDYDEQCPNASTSPDVVYSFRPTEENTAITIDLCLSEYDTKVYVYGPNLQLVACNDDTCGVNPPYNRSKITNLWLPFEELHYIVVDGANGDSGDYEITVELTLGACCAGSGACELTTEPECLASGRTWMGPETVCDPNPCIPTPVDKINWGVIKGQYR